MSFDYTFHIKKERPEEVYKDIREYYTNETLIKYAHSKSIMRTQEKITKRVLELLDFKNINKLILDAGCGPGFTSFYLKRQGFEVVSIDLIDDFLKVYDMTNLNPITSDMTWCPLRPNKFHAIISISALQWIYREVNDLKASERMRNLVESFNSILKRKGTIIIQFYPKNAEIMKKIGKFFIDYAPFEGGYIIDNDKNPKKRKIYLKLFKP